MWDDLPDGTQVTLRSVKYQSPISAKGGEARLVSPKRKEPCRWRTFKIWRHSDAVFSFQAVHSNMFLSARSKDHGGVRVAASMAKDWGLLTLTRNPSNKKQVHIRAWTGLYLQATSKRTIRADLAAAAVGDGEGEEEAAWGSSPATFEIAVFKLKDVDDLPAGARVQLKSAKHHSYVSCSTGVSVDREAAGRCETFKIWRHHPGTVYSFQTDGGKFVSAVNGGGGDVHADRASMPRESEWFTITRNPSDHKQVHIRARNGMYLQAKSRERITADLQSAEEPGWTGKHAAATFEMTLLINAPGSTSIDHNKILKMKQQLRIKKMFIQ